MRRNGLWINEREFVQFAEDPAQPTSLSQELAVRSRTLDYFGLTNLYLPNPDPILKSQGRDIRVYSDLMTDDRVAGGITNRINATLALSWDIDQGKAKNRQAKAVKEIFTKLPLTRITEQLIRGARAYGYCPTELLTARWQGINIPIDIVPKPQRWFVFNQENQLRFLTRTNLLSGEELPKRRFICPTNEASYENPYGLGLNSRCFWPVTFKRGGWRYLVQYAEKFGQTWPIGKLPRSATKDQIDDLLDTLERMIQDGVAVIPDDGSVELKESGSKGATSDLHRGIIQEANSAISTVWLGHAGVGESTSGGKLGDDKLSIEVRQDIRDADVRLVEEAYNQVIDYICEENWGSSEGAPRFTFIIEKEVDLKQAERDDKLTASLERSGKRLSSAYFERTYNLEQGDVEEAPAEQLPPAPTPKDTPIVDDQSAFAEPGDGGDATSDNADLLAVQAETAAEPFLNQWLTAAKKIVDGAGNLIDLRDDLLKQSAKLDIAPMAAHIRDALLISTLLGRAEVKDEIAASEAGASFADFSQYSFAESAITSALRLPFAEAIAFFRGKVNIPTEKWNDLFLDAHAKGFMIAGAMKGELLADLREAVDQTIVQGLTLADFRQQWDSIVERYGWKYVGGRNWRTRVVYETNTRQAYNAGRWQGITDPDVLATRPYLLYKHGDSVHPRVLHMSWDGTVLPADDPWWATHYPQNGWGCKCKVFSAGERDITRLGAKAKRTAPNDGSYTWTDKQGRSFEIPNGIDAGFQYNVGTAASKSRDILNERIDRLPPEIAKKIRAEIAQKDKR
jgi:phage gp29-like protein